MMKTFDLEVDGIKFQCLPLPLTERLKLDKQVLSLVAPIATAALSSANDMEAMTKALPEILLKLSDADFLKLINTTLSRTTAITGKGAVVLDNDTDRDMVFQDLMTMYKLVLEIWRYQKLTVFAVAANRSIGGLTDTITGQSEF